MSPYGHMACDCVHFHPGARRIDTGIILLWGGGEQRAG